MDLIIIIIISYKDSVRTAQ